MQLNTTFEPKVDVDGDQLKPSDVAEHPLIVKVYEHRTGITTKFKPDGSGTAVLVDVFDLVDGNVYVNVLWFNGAIVDNLVGYVGQDALAIKLIYKESKKGNSYLIPAPLEGDDLQAAIGWAQARPNVFDDTRRDRGIEPHASDVAGASLPSVGGAAAAPAAPAAQSATMPQAAPAAPPAAFGPGSNPAPAAAAPQAAPPAAAAPQAAAPQAAPAAAAPQAAPPAAAAPQAAPMPVGGAQDNFEPPF